MSSVMLDFSKYLKVVTFSPGPYNYYFPLPCHANFQIIRIDKTKRLGDAQQAVDAADIFLMENNPDLNRARRKYPWVFDIVQKSGKPWIVTEGPVFRKNHAPAPKQGSYYRWSWWSYFQNEGDYCNKNSPGDRWQRIQQEHNIQIQDWQQDRGDYILFMMQRPGDTSLYPVYTNYDSYEEYIYRTVSNIRKNTRRPIRIRLHPQAHSKQLPLVERALTVADTSVSDNSTEIFQSSVEGGNSLERDMDGAWAVVGFNSNSLTESVCMGIPTWSLHSSSMAWPVSHYYLSQLEKPNLSIDRTQWLYNLGYTQWRQDEVIAGLPFKHLLKKWDSVKNSNPYS